MESIFATHKTKAYTLAGKSVSVTWKIPTPVDMTEIALKGDRYIDFFQRFVTDIESFEINELHNAFPSDVVKLPGAWGLVQQVAKDIVRSSVIEDEEKKTDNNPDISGSRGVQSL